MTRTEQAEFLTSLIKSCEAEILKRSERFPETWDGHELRKYVADYFAGVVWGSTYMTDKRSKRYKDYQNECLVNNL